jgi:hypothetical protein
MRRAIAHRHQRRERLHSEVGDRRVSGAISAIELTFRTVRRCLRKIPQIGHATYARSSAGDHVIVCPFTPGSTAGSTAPMRASNPSGIALAG